MVRTIYQQPSPEEVHAQSAYGGVEQLHERFPQVAALLAEAGPDILAFTAFTVAHWRQIWSNNPLERLNKEIRRRPPQAEASSPTGQRPGGSLGPSASGGAR